MTERELIAAIAAMMPNAANVIGFRALMEVEGIEAQPVRLIEYECHAAAGGMALALQVHELVERLNAEGIEP